MVHEPSRVLNSDTAGGPSSWRRIVGDMGTHDPQCKESTVLTHVTSRMCINAPDSHGSVYGDLVRVDRGMFRHSEGEWRLTDSRPYVVRSSSQRP